MCKVGEISTVKNLHTSVNSVICEVHWTSNNYATVTLRGKTGPKDPPSVWPGVPTSCIPTPVPKERTILRSLISESYSTWWPEKFREQDALAFADLRKRLIDEKESFSCSTTVYLSSSSLCIQSSELSGGVPKFIIKIVDTLKFETLHMGVWISIPWLYKNNITQLQSWPTLEERNLFVIRVHMKLVITWT